jgi:hypothetical protein
MSKTTRLRGHWKDGLEVSGWRVWQIVLDPERSHVCDMCLSAFPKKVYVLEHVTGRLMNVGGQCKEKMRGFDPYLRRSMDEHDENIAKELAALKAGDLALAEELRQLRKKRDEETHAVIARFRGPIKNSNRAIEAYIWLEARVGTWWAEQLASQFHPEWFDRERISLYKLLSQRFTTYLVKRGKDPNDWLDT